MSMYQMPSHDDSTSLMGPTADDGSGLFVMFGSGNGTLVRPLT